MDNMKRTGTTLWGKMEITINFKLESINGLQCLQCQQINLPYNRNPSTTIKSN